MLAIYYTSNILGNLPILPRLHTFIRELKAQSPPPEKALLLDLGRSCAPDIWHCHATGGRSTLMVLDAMGYQAVNVTGLLTAEARERIEANLMATARVDGSTVWEDSEVIVSAHKNNGRVQSYLLQISLIADKITHLDRQTLYLADVVAGQVGIVRLEMAGGVRILAHDIVTMPAAMLPDPTITATVDFVLDEARYFQKRRAE